MEITLQVAPETKLLMNLLKNPNLLRSAKVNCLTNASVVFSNQSKREAPVDTGNLRRNITYKVQPDGSQSEVKAGTNYAIYQEEGTGIYGKRGTYITPKRAKFLRFKVKSGEYVFARKVKGVRGKWFMKKGAEFLINKFKDIETKLYNDIKGALNAR